MLEYAHIALCGPRQCMNMPVLHSLAPDSAISYPESAITMVEPRAIYYQREELWSEAALWSQYSGETSDTEW